MGLFSSKSSSSSSSYTQTNTSSGSVGIEGSNNQAIQGITAGNDISLNLSDMGAINAAFAFASKNSTSLENLLSAQVKEGQAARADLLSFAENLKSEATNAGQKNTLYVMLGVLAVAGLALWSRS